MLAYLGGRTGNHTGECETGLREEGGGREEAGKRKKDVKSWEQTKGFIENKRVRGFQGEKQTGFLVQKPPNKAKKGAQNAEFRGWNKETGNTDLARCWRGLCLTLPCGSIRLPLSLLCRRGN